jgi:hypothetical protein
MYGALIACFVFRCVNLEARRVQEPAQAFLPSCSDAFPDAFSVCIKSIPAPTDIAPVIVWSADTR